MNALVLMVLASTTAADRVVVFPDRAQVTRATTVQCADRVPVRFEGIPPAAAMDSFRAQIAGGSVDGMRAELVTNAEEFSPRVEALTKKRDSLRFDIESTTDAITRTQQQVRTGTQYQSIATSMISKEMAADRVDTKAWHTALETSLNASLAATRQIAELNAKLKAQRHDLEALQRELQELRAQSSKQSYVVEVLASCPTGKTAELALTYLVGGASWTPAYEARADEAKKMVELSTWATVQQSTGETWDGVALTLSTAVPSQNATPPTPRVLLVNAREQQPEKKVLVRRDEYMPSAQTSSTPVSAAGPAPMAARNQGLSVQLVVPEKARIGGDNAPVRLFVGKSVLPASFELRATPKAVPVAFRVAELSNGGAWPLLAGRLDAYRSTGLVGRYTIEHVAIGGAFTLTFGVEDAIRVKRTVIDELKRDTGLFNGNKRFTYSYQFEVANYGKDAREVSVAEHVPVSELDDIKVSIAETTTAGYQLDPKSGIAKWKVTLKPGEKKTIALAFRVDVPSSYETGGL